ncbi:TRAP transporter small permease [Pokkaliibacter sp. MBI-7]|uniref:TRAP transporter small permease n=1 Tax=Pokkaliibacter sp. MBI-7 TaxID=3040600 RepID=UPI00244B55A0|nr:TRAP transporter small permease [Pokkaliibacter sp. MBI-7]MDH2435409.1 TRAP transporter small permease [Pokkaliibacter sp. MBI-7]
MRFFIRLEEWVARVFLALIVLLVFGAAVARTFNHPIIWSVDMAQLLFVWVCVLGADQALRKREHIGVDILVRHFPAQVRGYLDVLLYVLIIAFLVTLAIRGFELTWLNKERRFGDSNISYAFVTVAVPVGCVLLTITSLGHIWTLIGKLRRNEVEYESLSEVAIDQLKETGAEL